MIEGKTPAEKEKKLLEKMKKDYDEDLARNFI